MATSLVAAHATPSSALGAYVDPTIGGGGSPVDRDGNVKGTGGGSEGSEDRGGMAGTSGATADCDNRYSPNRDGDVIVADNYEQTIYYDNLTPEMASQTTWALNSQYQPLDTDVNYLSSVNSLTDVVVYDHYYYDYCGKDWWGSGGDVVGLTTCVSRNSAGECEKHELRYDNNWTTDPNKTESQRRQLACHEMGHTFGLLHSPGGCMYADINGANTGLSAQDRGLINWWYDPPSACCGKNLSGDQSLTSDNSDWRLVCQSDGNLVGYHRRQNDNGNDTPFWSSGTSGHSGATCVMQADGNLVIYYQGRAIWNTATDGHPNATIVMQNDRNIVIYPSGGGGNLWNSATNI